MLDRFAATSAWVDIDGPVHYVDFGGSGRPIVMVHGLGGSHTNWLAVGAPLARHGRVVAIDLSGFGLTPPARRGSTVAANLALLSRFLGEVAGEPAILVGNSMGGALSLLHAAAEPEMVAGLVLVDPALPYVRGGPIDGTVASHFAAYALPGLGELYVRRRFDRLGPERLVAETMALCCVDPSRVPADVIAAGVEVRRRRMAMPWAHRSFLSASRSLMGTLLRRDRFEQRVKAIRSPGILIHGADDRLVSAAAARRLASLRPDWDFHLLQDVGHVPQLEVPARFVGLVTAWLDSID